MPEPWGGKRGWVVWEEERGEGLMVLSWDWDSEGCSWLGETARHEETPPGPTWVCELFEKSGWDVCEGERAELEEPREEEEAEEEVEEASGDDEEEEWVGERGRLSLLFRLTILGPLTIALEVLSWAEGAVAPSLCVMVPVTVAVAELVSSVVAILLIAKK
jgi:hypothetical protein